MFKKILAVFFVLVTIFAVTAFAGCKKADGESENSPAYVTGDEVQTPDADGGEGEDTADITKSLIIPVSTLTTNAKFFGVCVDGTYMEVIALKSGSTYRTAFNTCQVCYGSRTAYYKQSGNYLVCQNCGSRFALSAVGTKTSSCCPYPILESDRTTDGTNIIIPYDFLVKTKNLFKVWKVT